MTFDMTRRAALAALLDDRKLPTVQQFLFVVLAVHVGVAVLRHLDLPASSETSN